MQRVLLFLCFLLMESSASSAGGGAAPQCPPQWLLFGHRCYSFFPVWSSWITANSLCSLTGGSLVSLQTLEEKKFVLQLATSSTPVWLGRSQERQEEAESEEGGACVELAPKSGEVRSAPCGELRFYICSTSASFDTTDLNSREPPVPGLVPGVSLFDVLWGSSDDLAEEIFRSSSLFRGFLSGRLTQLCYTRFIQQEELYLHRVTSSLEALIGGLNETSEINSLLKDKLTQYRRKTLNPVTSPPPQWLQVSLQSFHSVVLEDPVYWLVAVSARACLQSFLAQKLLSELGPNILDPRVYGLYQTWRIESVDDPWIKRYQKVLEENQDQMDVYKAINIFRQHMMSEKELHKYVACEDEDDEGDRGCTDCL